APLATSYVGRIDDIHRVLLGWSASTVHVIIARPDRLRRTESRAHRRDRQARTGKRSMAKFTRRDFIKASVATGIVAGTVAAPAVFSPFRRSVLATGAASAAPLPGAMTAMQSTFNLN